MKGIPLGFKSDGSFRVYRDNGHLLTIAPPRSGKATDLLIPALLLCEHSCFVIDPKGQLAAVTARRRREMGQEVVLLNPFNIWPEYLGGFDHRTFNPCSVLDAHSPSFATDCDGQSEALVLPDSAGPQNKYFTLSAQQLVSGLLMYVVRRFAPAERNLLSVYDIATVPEMLEVAVKKAVALNDPLITGRLSRFTKSDSDQRKSIGEIVLSAITELGFMGNKAIRESLRSSAAGTPELRFKDLRRRPMTVYLILPLEYVTPCAKWFRLVLEAAMFDLMHDFGQSGPGRPVLMMLDEFAQLGRLQIIEAAEAQAAGFGVQLWPVLQDYGQLTDVYDKRASSFVAGAGISTYYAPREDVTAEHISKRCGVVEVNYETKSIGEDVYRSSLPGAPPGYGFNVNQGYQRQVRPMQHPDEVMRMGPDKMYVFYKGQTIYGNRRSYLKSPEFAGMYDPDPYHAPPKQRQEDDDKDTEGRSEEWEAKLKRWFRPSEYHWFCKACNRAFKDNGCYRINGQRVCPDCKTPVEGPGRY